VDESSPTKEMRDVKATVEFITECVTNAHHIIWTSSGTNPGKESLME
jgi:hypothetical protein